MWKVIKNNDPKEAEFSSEMSESAHKTTLLQRRDDTINTALK